MKPNRISCGEVREKLPLYVGGDLDPDALDAVRGHLELCGECARLTGRATAARRELVAAFRAQESGIDSPGLWPGIRAKLLIEGRIHSGDGAEVRAASPRARPTRWIWALAPLAAAAALLLFMKAGGELGPDTLPKPPGPRTLPVPEVVVAPVSAPARGTLETIPPEEASQAAPYRARRGSRGPADEGVSLAGYNNSRIK
jgi:hypothetical protein